MQLIGVKIIVNRVQSFKKLLYIEDDDTLASLLLKINEGEFADNSQGAVFYFGHNDDYDTSKMHETPEECTFSELLRGNDSRVYILIKIDYQDADVTQSSVPNAFDQLRSAQTTLILPRKDKYKHTGMNNLWNWLIDDYLTPTAARFKKDQRDDMDDFMKKMHEVLWYEI